MTQKKENLLHNQLFFKSKCLLYLVIFRIRKCCVALFSHEWLTSLQITKKQALICFEHTTLLLLVMIFFLCEKKHVWLEPSWRPSQYFEMACLEFITANDALFITAVFTSMNIQDGSTRLEWGRNCKTD